MPLFVTNNKPMKKMYVYLLSFFFLLVYSCGNAESNDFSHFEESENNTETVEQNTTEEQSDFQKTVANIIDSTNSFTELFIYCPYCISEINEQTTICSHCEQNTRDDAPFEMTKEEFNNLDKKECPSCTKQVPTLAINCSFCKKKV